MTEPWKDWEHEGDMSADRLRPSEVKELLCAADGWKMIYQGVTFYFQFDEEGNRLVVNTENNGRFHTDWLNMIYPRLRIAKDLLSDLHG